MLDGKICILEKNVHLMVCFINRYHIILVVLLCFMAELSLAVFQSF